MLIGERVSLRGMERADLPAFVRWLNVPATRAQIARSSPPSLADEERWFEAMGKSAVDVIFTIQTLSARETPPRAIGTCGLHKIDWKHRGCTLGILIGDDDDRGRGFGTDAVRCLLRHAFADLGLYRVELEVFPDNVAAISSYQRCGFVVEGTRRGAIFKEGVFKDLVLMSVLAQTPASVSPAVSPRKPKRAQP